MAEANETRELSLLVEEGAGSPADEAGTLAKDEYLTIKEAARYRSIAEPVLRLTIRGGKKVVRR